MSSSAQNIQADYQPSSDSSEAPLSLTAEVSEKLVSSTYAIVCSVASIVILWQARNDMLRGQAPILVPFTYFIMWYFVYDLYAMYDSYCLRMSLRGSFLKKATTFCRTNIAIVAHHVVILLIGVPLDIVSGHFLPIPCMYTLIIPNLSCMQMYVWRKDLGDFIIGCFMIHDMANPFLHTTHILKLLNQTNSKVFQMCAVMTVCSFAVFRLLTYPFMIAVYTYQYDLSTLQALSTMKVHCHAFFWSALALQVHWFYGIIRVYRKHLQKKD
eukprot:Em0015g635a